MELEMHRIVVLSPSVPMRAMHSFETCIPTLAGMRRAQFIRFVRLNLCPDALRVQKCILSPGAAKKDRNRWEEELRNQLSLSLSNSLYLSLWLQWYKLFHRVEWGPFRPPQTSTVTVALATSFVRPSTSRESVAKSLL